MHLSDLLTPYTVFLAGIVIVMITLIAIYLRSRKERQELEELSNKVAVYNESIDAYEEGVLILSQRNDVLFVNQEFADYFGLKSEKIDRSFLQRLKLIDIHEPHEEIGFLDAVERRKYISDVQVSGMLQPAPVKISSNLFRDPSNPNAYWRVIVMHDLTEYYRLQKQIQKTQSYNDLLTDLPIQGRLVSDLVDANLRSNLHGNAVILAFFGIKHFASMRSLLGYKRTNEMIQFASDILKHEVGEGEKLYYRGRGDFAILIGESTDPGADILRIKNHLRSLKDGLHAQGMNVEISQAIMQLQGDKRTPDAIIDRCHELQLDSERFGKEEFEASDAETLSQELPGLSNGNERQFSRSDFANAIQRKEFFSFYQPIFSLEDDRLIGAEYLMRWNHPKYGLLNASEFLDIAVRHNMLTEITDYLLENVLSHKASWDNLGIDDFNLSINFALPELRVANFAEKLELKLNEHAIDAETITIDLSEKLLSGDIRILRNEVSILKQIGVRIAIDSFGEGFTHLKLLEELPIDTIKIDRSLIRDIEINPDKRKLVSAIIAMGKSLGVSVGATWIDSASIRDTLKQLKCDYGQGYYYSKALPFFEMLNFIQSHRQKETTQSPSAERK
jgi:EAL domain-containing protein (putative c-di-GMP-specific phosphodiesterase class I)/GGDEF domain-containing protein